MLEKSVNLIGAPVPYETFDNSDRASLNARHHRIAHCVLNDIGDIEIDRRRCFHAFVQSVIGDRRDWLSAGLFVKPAAGDDARRNMSEEGEPARLPLPCQGSLEFLHTHTSASLLSPRT